MARLKNFLQQLKQGPFIIFSLYTFEACIKALLNCLSMENITFSLQTTCTI